MSTSVVIFCYAGDSELLPCCVAAVCNAVEGAVVHLVDDAANPISHDLAEALTEGHPGRVVYRQSSFGRGGNLRGKECILGMLDEMIAACDADGSEIVIKVDCDTLVMRAGWLDDFAASPAEYAGSSRPGTFASGVCYAIKTPLLHRVREGVAGLDIRPGSCEDVVICCVSAALSQPMYTMMIACQSRYNLTARWSAYSYHFAASPETYARRFDVLTFGNAALAELAPSCRTAPMQSVWEAFLRKSHPSAS